MPEETFIGGKLFSSIEIDDRVTSDLSYCLYCKTTNNNPNGSLTATGYLIPLDCIKGNAFKQCPSCKRVYILKDKFDDL